MSASLNSISPYNLPTYYQNQLVNNPYGGSTLPTINTNIDTLKTSATKTSAASDGKDDGKIGFWKGVGNFLKGAKNAVVNTVKSIVTDPKKLLVTAGAIALGIVCPPAGVAMAVAGGVAGAITVGKGVYNAATADTDAEAEAAFQEMGGGALQVGLAVVGTKAGIKTMKNINGSAMSTATGLRGNIAGYFKDAKCSITGGNGYNGLTVVKNIKSNGFTKGSSTGQKITAVKDGLKNTYDDFKGGSEVKLTKKFSDTIDDVKRTGQEAKTTKAKAKYSKALDDLENMKNSKHSAGELKKAYETLNKTKEKLNTAKNALDENKGGLLNGTKQKIADSTKLYSKTAKSRATQQLDDYVMKGKNVPESIKTASLESIKKFIVKNKQKLTLKDYSDLSKIISLKQGQSGSFIGTTSMLGKELSQVGAYKLDTTTGPQEHLYNSYLSTVQNPSANVAYNYPTSSSNYSSNALSELYYNEATGMWA